MNKFELMYNINLYGDKIAIGKKMNDPREFIKWTEKNFEYVTYNSRKGTNHRYGLSITSLDGGLSGVPDLDSIYEHNFENNTNYTELDFNVPTPVYYYKSLSKLLDPIKNCVTRSHILKLKPGGFFPPHRDARGNYLETFRLLIPLQNCNPPRLNFVLEDKICNWENGRMYFLNTFKMHYLFNSSYENSYIIVVNALLNEDTVSYVTNNMLFK